jgi:TPR repeat protein
MPISVVQLRRALLVSCAAWGLAGGLAAANESQNVQNLRQRAEAGDSTAQLELARAFDGGRGVKASLTEAAKWYEAAARQGNAEAQNSIGSLYLSGEGVPKDAATACAWFAKSAAQSDARGIGNLGYCYDTGTGVPQDTAKAAALYEQAANAGDLQSMLNIGIDYWKGEGVAQDHAKAYMWLNLVRFYTQTGSANRSLKWRSRGELDALSKEIAPDVRAQGESLTLEWDKANRSKVQSAAAY